MKKISIFTISALIAMAMLSLTACELWSGEINDTTHDPNDPGPPATPPYTYTILDADNDGCCDYCDSSRVTVPLVLIEFPNCERIDKKKTFELNFNKSMSSTVVTTTVEARSDSFDCLRESEETSIQWTDVGECIYELKLKEDAAPSGMIEFTVTSSWLEENQYDSYQLSETRKIQVFYAKNDISIAFSTVSADMAMAKLLETFD